MDSIKLNLSSRSLSLRLCVCKHVCKHSNIQFKLLSSRWNIVETEMTGILSLGVNLLISTLKRCHDRYGESKQKYAYSYNKFNFQILRNNSSINPYEWKCLMAVLFIQHVFVHSRLCKNRLSEFSYGLACRWYASQKG